MNVICPLNKSVICPEHKLGGFFSCCSIKLMYIVLYANLFLKIPDYVDSSQLFLWYKEEDKERDITYNYFEHYNNINEIINIKTPIENISENSQYNIYSLLDFNSINPFVKKYFSPSKSILKFIEDIEKKYNIDYNNICVLFYRGNDKNRETVICDYSEYLVYANKILENNPDILFLIQSDETEFINFISEKFPNNSFYLKDEIRHIPKCDSTVDIILKDKNPVFSKYYLAITIIMSKCKYIICGTGNCSFWIILYRGNSNNVIQNSNNKWYYNNI
jgi:hypothetical protein